MRCVIRQRKSQHGQALIESIVCMLLTCLVLFGLLQVFYLYVAQMVMDYSSFMTARTSCVGFADYLVDRSSRIASIGASGKLVDPADYGGPQGSPLSQFGFEKIRIPEFVQGVRYLEYEYWNPAENATGAYISNAAMRTADGCLEATVTAQNYPLDLPMREAYTTSKSVDIIRRSGTMDYSADYLE